jgi:hypothetical protein
MSSDIHEYYVVVYSTVYKMQKVVNEYIKLGWEPVGGMSVIQYHNFHEFCQPMIYREVKKNETVKK